VPQGLPGARSRRDRPHAEPRRSDSRVRGPAPAGPALARQDAGRLAPQAAGRQRLRGPAWETRPGRIVFRPHPGTRMGPTLKIAVLPGDGIGPEITRQATRVLEALAKDGLS